MPVGRVEEFKESQEDFGNYIERLEQWMLAIDIEDGKKVCVFLSVIGAETYKLLKNLISPKIPSDKSYDNLKAALLAHYMPKPLVIAERFRFKRTVKKEGQSVNDYAVALRQSSANCDFGQFLNDALRDQFVSGLCSEAIQLKLLGQDYLTYQRALELTLQMEMLTRLERYNVKVKLSKCKFFQSSVEYLGHHIDREGLHPTDEKVTAIVKAPKPNNVTELRLFLGLLNYYGKFLPNLSSLLQPIHNLLRDNVKWNWTAECDAAFEKAKQLLLKSKVLVATRPLKLACDASPYGVGAVISHVMDNGEEQPIAFASGTLSDAEKNYAQIEKEALAIIYGVKKFHKYLYGRKFALITDHKPLLAILGPKSSVPTLAALRMQRWAIILMAYNYSIEYRRSADH